MFEQPVTATPAVSVKRLHKRFGQLEVLKGIDLEVSPSEVIRIIGPLWIGQEHAPALYGLP